VPHHGGAISALALVTGQSADTTSNSTNNRRTRRIAHPPLGNPKKSFHRRRRAAPPGQDLVPLHVHNRALVYGKDEAPQAT
jgi:hypothetical protein